MTTALPVPRCSGTVPPPLPGTTTSVRGVEVTVAPSSSVATSVSCCAPSVGNAQTNWKGATVDSPVRLAPAKYSTPAMLPSLSAAAPGRWSQ
jgi:hypothetical protein